MMRFFTLAAAAAIGRTTLTACQSSRPLSSFSTTKASPANDRAAMGMAHGIERAAAELAAENLSTLKLDGAE